MGTSDSGVGRRDPGVDVPDPVGCTTASDGPGRCHIPVRLPQRSEAT